MAARRRPTWRWAASSTRCGKSSARATLNRCWRRCCSKNPHTCRVLLTPSHTLGQERERRRHSASLKRRLSGRIRRAKRCWRSSAPWRSGSRRRTAPRRWRRCPRLDLGKIAREPKALPLACMQAEGLPVLVHQVATGGILHLNWYFALDDLTPEEIPVASFLAQVLTNVPTRSHSLEELQREIRTRLGSLRFGVEAYERQGDPTRCRAFLTVQCSFLEQKRRRRWRWCRRSSPRPAWRMGRRSIPSCASSGSRLPSWLCRTATIRRSFG